MSESKYMPGPWTIEEYGDDETPALVIHKDTENRICFMATPGSHGDPAKIEADARLIAAAPDLLEALRELREQTEPEELLDDESKCWLKARAAILKATGQQR